MAWDVQYRDGVWLPQIGWWLDAHHPVDRSFVSHAHFDHLAAHREVLCSEGTRRLMHDRLPAARNERVLPFGQTAPLTPESSVSLHPAGHIFGSAQALIEHEDHGRLLYTGDFKLRAGRSAERCVTPRADVVIMETTFGRPHYRFPPTEEILQAILNFCVAALDEGEVPVLFGYSLGKSQEVLSSLAEARLPVMLHPQSLRMTRIYEELGLRFPPYRPFDAAQVDGHVVISPPQAASSSFLKSIRRRRTAVLTGWAMDPGARFRYQCDAAFPLSDHADYPDLLRYVELVQPQRVLTLHGFAADFARVLRDRGIEAWAINQDNQLEMALALPESSPTPRRPRRSDPSAANCTEDCFIRFAATAEAVRRTPKKLEKVALLGAYLQSLESDDAARASVFLTGRPFPQSSDLKLSLGWAAMRRAVLAVSGANDAAWRAAYRQYADSGDAAESLLADRAAPAASVRLSEIETFLHEAAGARGPAAKIELLEAQLRRLTAVEAKYLLKIMSGDLRIGLKEGLVEEAIATATSTTVGDVRAANMLCGDIGHVVRSARQGGLEAIELRVFLPLQFMLASPEPTAEALLARLGAPLWLEEKYDGIRCQVHRCGSRVELYSRDLHRITDQFPDLARAALGLPQDCILDGELLAWRDGRALPFAELQKRLGRKGDDFFLGAEIPVSFSAYDLLWRDGQAMLHRPLRERRQALEQLLTPANPKFDLAPVNEATTAVEIEAAFLRARQRGNEGLMAKDPSSAYTPGRRGLSWLKLKKAYATLDVVVVAVEYGHGKRRGVLSDYTFAVRDETTDQLLTVGKAYSGLTDVEIAQLTQHFLEHTLEDHGRYRVVEPDTVLEVAFDSIQPSRRHDSGFALRFPRIARIRADKTPREIDTLETCRRLAAATKDHPDAG
jgi:DNA ligase 1